MKISLNWLKQYIQLSETPTQIAALLTGSGLEVESWEEIESIKGGLKGLVIGEVITCTKHPNADKLSITTVDIGLEALSPIVCGAPNVRAGQKVVVATVGSQLYPVSGDPFQIKKAKIRGEVSEGMICAEDEIGLGISHDGILVLNTELPNGAPAAEYFKLESDFVFEIGLTPNRADGASHFGVARDLKALLGRDLNIPSIEKFKINNRQKKVDVIVENKEACPRYSALTISNIKVAESPNWLKTRLKSIGINPTNNVVDATNFILHSIGQPMHAFDLDKIRGNKVIVKTLAEGSKFTTLDEKERTLAATDLMICNNEEGMCIAGVFGGTQSGVKSSTTSIFLESAYFSADSIRKSAQKHQLKTDASFRYERGTDPNITVYALKYAALLIQEIAGGEISSDITDIYPNPIEHFKVEASYDRITTLIGKDLGKSKVNAILRSLDIDVTNETEKTFIAIVPPYRVDVQREADLVEEVLRIYGYNNIEISDHLSSSFLSEFPIKDADGIKKTTLRLMAGVGFNEIVTNSLTKDGYSLGISGLDEEHNVKVLNYLSEDLNVMRQSLLFSGLEVIDRNIKRRNSDLKLFEFGTTYHYINQKYVEKLRLSVFITGNRSPESWLAPAVKIQFHDLAAIVYKLLAKFGVTRTDIEDVSNDIFSYGITISTNKKPIVQLGKVSAKAASLTGINNEIFYADFDWDYMHKLSSSEFLYSPISKYPEVKRDLSLVIDKAIKFDDIRKLSSKLEKTLIQRISVFDVYEGDKIDSGKKAYAISFYLQDQEQTLTDKVIDKTMTKLIQGFEREFGAIIRK
jgi:phenylalanyl-tRNA synthetase beta chain